MNTEMNFTEMVIYGAKKIFFNAGKIENDILDLKINIMMKKNSKS